MESDIVIMLTWNDKTVKNAMDVFQDCKDLPANNWGFKDVGIPVNEMIELNKAMKEAGKTTFLEVVTYTEEECLKGASLAMECGFDYLTGTIFFPSIVQKLRGSGIKYFPFAGDVGGSPVTLKGSIKDIVEDSRRIIVNGADGVDLTAYRFANGDGTELAMAVADAVGRGKLMIAGSIGNVERMDIMTKLAPFGYTMGSALFNENFVKGGGFKENLEYVLDYRKERE
mgnify:CR=1 FL=1